MNVTISELWIYPVKSCRGISLDSAEVLPRGLAFDRRFMLIDSEGKFLSQRTLPAMARLRTRLEADNLIISTDGAPDLGLPLAGGSGPEVSATVWEDTCQSIDQGDDAAQWFSGALGTDCRLVFMPDSTTRTVDQDFGRPSDSVGFADGYPILLISQGSLDELNRKLDQPVPMNRFRPNIVVSGCPPHAEDEWSSIEIGNVTFLLVKPCSRCPVVTTDQASGERFDEPLRTLSTYRLHGGKILFGQNLVHDGAGHIACRDACNVTTARTV